MPNPIIAGFHPDPSICRVGAEYFLACSSFEYFPGVPLFHSTDLWSWTQIGNVLDRPGQLRLATTGSSGGVYAPTLRHHDDRFWLITTNVSDSGHLIVTAEDPAGPWSDPTIVEGLAGIDPDLAWDDDGTCWLTYSGSAIPGVRPGGIMQAPIDPYAGTVLRPPRPLWSGTGLAYPEAPHLYNVDGRWYLVIAEGGTERGHAISVARADAPDGPYEGCPDNPVLSHRSTTRPVQNTGHGDLVRAVDGTWWMVLLGVRPGGGSPRYHVLGRETFLTEVRWRDGWPIPEPVVATNDATADDTAAPGRERDEFTGTALGHHWVGLRQPPSAVSSLTARPGWLSLRATADGLDGPMPAFVGRRQQHPGCLVRARVEARPRVGSGSDAEPAAGRGGLAVRLDEAHHYEIEVDGTEVVCRARIGPLCDRVAAHPVEPGPVVLAIGIAPDAGTAASTLSPPDRIRLGFVPPGAADADVDADAGADVGGGVGVDGIVWLATLDGRYLSTEVAGGFTGRVIGMYAAAGDIGVDWFDYAWGQAAGQAAG